MLFADGYVRIYRFLEEGRRLELVHRTAVEGVPAAMAAFKGRLLVGVDATLRLFDLGERDGGAGGGWELATGGRDSRPR